MTKFYQCDVAESDTDSIWTGSIHYCESVEEAEFLTMLDLQRDWGDSYIPDAFVAIFGDADCEEPLAEFPGPEAWNAAGYWNDVGATTGMLEVPPLEALASLGKIEFELNSADVKTVMLGGAKLRVVMRRDEACGGCGRDWLEASAD